MELPAHLGFVVAAYAVVVGVVAGLLGYLVVDHRRLKRRIGDLEARGAASRRPAREDRR